MSFQKCPVCNGTGIDPSPGTFNTVPVCPTCKGARIINELSGLPPACYMSTQKPTQDVSNISSEGSQLQEHKS